MPINEPPEPADEPDHQPQRPFAEDHQATSADFAQAGAFVLDAYTAGVLPGSIIGDHRTDPKLAAELLGAVMHDLFHYADHFHVDMQTAVSEARTIYADRRLDESPYRIGTLVQLTEQTVDQPGNAYLARRGVVTDVILQPGRPTLYEVTSTADARATFTAEELQPGPPFRPIPIRDGVIDTPADAEKALIEVTARLGLADQLGQRPHPCDLDDRNALLSALAAWTGLHENPLLERLAPAFEQGLIDLETAHTRHPADLASASFPLGPTDKPSPPPTGTSRPPRPDGPHRGPRPH